MKVIDIADIVRYVWLRIERERIVLKEPLLHRFMNLWSKGSFFILVLLLYDLVLRFY